MSSLVKSVKQNGKRILVLEDEFPLLRIITQRLHLAGYTVDGARDSDEAARAMLKNKPDLIWLDVYLPNENGLDFLERIRQDKRYKKIPAVVIANSSAEDKVERATKLGAFAYLVKAQHTLGEIVERINTILK
ncbi:MAG: Alkaline phosphatase synthesis transcriptional regulatory protein PhoP, two-component system, OmpR [Candidatus Magasanikbacteria bacterium]|nr:Alkaline phosphatase synthesis transcriptional regulatory protein PhoP, two-component system, OmpR [Candidatus Magasanikbacteria bacterium]